MKIGNRPELYVKTVDILYQAYFNDTLEHGNFCGCAVGNLVAANMGKTFEHLKNGSPIKVTWAEGGTAAANHWYALVADDGSLLSNRNIEEGTKQIRSTGYLLPEIIAIEKAFESAHVNVDLGEGTDEQMFNGLVAVLNVLAKLHDVQEDIESFPRFDAVYSSKRKQLS